MTDIIDGWKIAGEIIESLEVEEGTELSVVLVGDDPVSLSYISQKEKLCKRVGIDFSLHKFSPDITKDELKEEIKAIRSSGIIVQLPLPKEINSQDVLDAIDPERDVDLLTTASIGRYYSGNLSILPPTVNAVAMILRGDEVAGKNVVVVGAGRLVGRPTAHWFVCQKATVSILNSLTDRIKDFLSKADIIVSGVGKSGLIRGEMIKEGAIVIDAGSSSEKGVIGGDVDINSVLGRASKISPVPGGVGPITTASLILNLVKFKKIYG